MLGGATSSRSHSRIAGNYSDCPPKAIGSDTATVPVRAESLALDLHVPREREHSSVYDVKVKAL